MHVWKQFWTGIMLSTSAEYYVFAMVVEFIEFAQNVRRCDNQHEWNKLNEIVQKNNELNH